MSKKRYGMTQRGFSLLELLIVMLILSIIAAFALPTYRRYVIATNEKAAMAKLMELATSLESHKSQYGTYKSSFIKQLEADNAQLPASGDARYTLAIDSTATDGYSQTYTITATPTAFGQQNDSHCGELMLDNFLIKKAIKDSVEVFDCWD